jgi:serine-type D-Ala-D-Ala carboxypeptidase/endopeptidase (penicillin-binding protein 4)
VLGDSGKRYAVVAIVNHANASAAKPVLDAVVQWAAEDNQR